MEQSLDMRMTPLTLFKFAFPTMIANLCMSIYTTIDGIFVANCVNTNALAAVNIVMPYIIIALALGTITGTGGSAIVSRHLGEGKMDEARQDFSFLCLTCFMACVAMSVLSYIFRGPLLRLLGTSDLIFDYCVDYHTPMIFAAPLALLGIALQSFFIATGKPGLGMSISLIGGVVNVFLDWILIAQLDMGTAGAAIASGIGYSIPGIAGVLYFAFARKGTLYFVKPKWNGKVLLKTITNGSSEMVALVASGITTIAMNNIMMRLRGEDGVAAISILLFTMTLLSDLYMGYALGVAPITSYNLGADHKDKLKQEHKINLKIIGICSVVMYLLGMLLKNLLICIYADKGTAVYEIAAEGYWLFSIGFLYMGFNLYASSFFTSLGEGKASALVSFYRGLVFLIVALYGMSSLFGVTGLYLAVPVAEFLGLGSTAYFMKKLKSKYHYA